MSGLNKNNKFKLYINKNIDLIRSMNIKSEAIVDAMNSTVSLQTNKNVYDDKINYKYYQNISGNYHFTDSSMNIISLDTGDTILFNKENLKVHKATKKEYSDYKSRYYIELITSYPLQELLINSILNPVDINYAIDSKDGTILSYSKELVEENEYNLIDKLQGWIYAYINRWINKEYNISDEYYLCLTQSQLYLHLLQILLCYRLNNCKTNQAHSYHIERYLASHGYLDKYLSKLTKSQSLFFYRNICYIERNPGKKDTFDWVLNNTMTVRNLPIYEYVVSHNTKDLSSESLYPTLIIDRVPINEPAKLDNVASLTFNQTLNSINNVVSKNEEYNIDNINSIENKLIINDSNIIYTKSLQSVVIDKTDVSIYPIIDTSVNNWINLVSENIYKPNITIDLPNRVNPITLTSTEAVIVHNAIKIILSQGVENTLSLPVGNIECIAIINKDIKYNDIVNISEKKYMLNKDIDTILNVITNIEPIYSIDDFKEIYNNEHINKHSMFSLYSSKEHMLSRVNSQVVINKIYENKLITIDGMLNKTYLDVFKALNIDIEKYSNSNIYELYNDITNKAIGNDLTKNKIEILQKNMSDLLLSLSSYSIQIMNEVNKEPIIIIPRISVRLGDLNSYILLRNKISINYVNLLKQNNKSKNNLLLNKLKKLIIYNVSTINNIIKIDLPKFNNKLTVKNNNKIKILSVPSKGIKNKNFSNFNTLTHTQKLSLLT